MPVRTRSRWRPRRARSSGCSSLGKSKQSSEAPGLWLGDEEAGGERGKPPGIVGNRLAYALVLIEPIDRIRAVNGFDYGGQPSW
jgi:hypothetical protein